MHSSETWETDFYPVLVLGRIALSLRFSSPSPVLDENSALLGPKMLSSTGAGVWRKAPKAFPGSSSVLDKFQSAKKGLEQALAICKTKKFRKWEQNRKEV